MGWDGGGAVLAGTLELLDGADRAEGRAEGEGERPRLGIFFNLSKLSKFTINRDGVTEIFQKSSKVVRQRNLNAIGNPKQCNGSFLGSAE